MPHPTLSKLKNNHDLEFLFGEGVILQRGAAPLLNSLLEMELNGFRTLLRKASLHASDEKKDYQF
jgi:hypothetical protein